MQNKVSIEGRKYNDRMHWNYIQVTNGLSHVSGLAEGGAYRLDG